MTLLRRFFPCLVAAVLVVPPALVAAAPLALPHDFALPLLRTANAARGPRANEAKSGAIGSSNTVTADARVPRPNEAPCVVSLFSNATFSQYAAQTFPYAPPANCPGPYTKIVFNGNFGVSAGVQFDRTAAIEVGNVPVYFGTTSEPGSSLGPTWHVERDVTEDAALFASPQTTEADIFNIVDSTYTGVISGTAFLQFYPATAVLKAAPTPDVVLPFPGVAGGPQHIATPASPLTATYTLPTNTERAYLDVYAQSQSTDEQYFNCAPTDVASELFSCPNGPLRETEIAIDGMPAGVAPVYPWIYTGGLDPYLWFPIPGVQTLEFKSYRVDLTPFAGVLANGSAHTITLDVDNADNYFQAIGTLSAYEDHGSKSVTGRVTVDTLTATAPATTVEHLHGTSPSVDGSILVTSERNYAIKGVLKTSHGLITSYVVGSLDFANHQLYSDEGNTTGTLAMDQMTTATTTSARIGPSGVLTLARSTVSFPLREKYVIVLDSTGTGTQVTTIDQHFRSTYVSLGPTGFSASHESNEVTPVDTLDILDDEFITGNSGQASTQTYSSYATGSGCYTQTIAAANNVVTAVSPPTCDPSEAMASIAHVLADAKAVASSLRR